MKRLAVRAFGFCAILALSSGPVRSAPAHFSVDDVLSAPYQADLAASADGRALVWTVHVRGARNIAVWQDGAARLITHNTADDGQDLASPQLMPGAKAVLYARGGSDESDSAEGANPNPLSLAQPPSRRIVITSITTGKNFDLGDGTRPVVSPKGDRVAWEARGQVEAATLASSDGGSTWTAGKPARLFTVHGSAREIVWSPDSTRIAVTNARDGNHTWIAVYEPGAKSIVYAAPGYGVDGDPAWSPDGSTIAFVRKPGPRFGHNEVYDPPSAAPWSIVTADVRTGLGRTIWTAARGAGHVFYANTGGPHLWWSHDGQRLAFLWERTGWLHLNAMSSTGGDVRDLTPGKFEVEEVRTDIEGRSLVYTSNAADIDRRHLWRVPFSGGEPQAQSARPDSQWSPVPLADGRLAYIDGGYADPPAVTVRESGSAHPLTVMLLPREYPSAALVAPQPVTFRAADGVAIHGQLFVPADGLPRHPALIFVHGGPPRQMLPGYHYMEPYAKLYQLNQALVNRGFVLLSVNYRSGIMYGHDFREAPRTGWLGASEYQDVLAAAAFLRARPDVDRSRLGIYGLSYGGYLTALALARNSDIFAAGADQAGISDWRALFDNAYGRPIGTPEQRRIAFAASPDASLERWRSPVFLSQADDDRNVPFDQSVDLATNLRAHGIDLTEAAVPDDLHAYVFYANELARFTQTADFLSARLNAPH